MILKWVCTLCLYFEKYLNRIDNSISVKIKSTVVFFEENYVNSKSRTTGRNVRRFMVNTWKIIKMVYEDCKYSNLNIEINFLPIR